MSKDTDSDAAPFARKMVLDHTKTSMELKQLVDRGKVRATLPTALDDQKKLDQLKSLSGPEFDRAYDQAQLEGHQQAVALFERYSTTGDNPDLKAWAAETLMSLRVHLDLAEKLR